MTDVASPHRRRRLCTSVLSNSCVNSEFSPPKLQKCSTDKNPTETSLAETVSPRTPRRACKDKALAQIFYTNQSLLSPPLVTSALGEASAADAKVPVKLTARKTALQRTQSLNIKSSPKTVTRRNRRKSLFPSAAATEAVATVDDEKENVDPSGKKSKVVTRKSSRITPSCPPVKSEGMKRTPTCSLSSTPVMAEIPIVSSLKKSSRKGKNAKRLSFSSSVNYNEFHPTSSPNSTLTGKRVERKIPALSESPITRGLAKMTIKENRKSSEHKTKLSSRGRLIQNCNYSDAVLDEDDDEVDKNWENDVSNDDSSSDDSSGNASDIDDGGFVEDMSDEDITVCLSKSKVKNRSIYIHDDDMALPDRSCTRKMASALEEARSRLHVRSVPKTLPCRDEEFNSIFNFVESKLLEESGGCIYISGLPGTGKSATVMEVLRYVSEMPDLPDFDSVVVNGMKVTQPTQVYCSILRQLHRVKASATSAMQKLQQELTTRKKPCILVVDELDMLCTRKQDVLYNLFDWPSKPKSRLIVLAIANAMDLPERVLIHRVSSRLGLTRVVFQPYSHEQLTQIVLSRIRGLSVFEDKAVELAARKVSAVSGDARRALDICRRSTELAEEEFGGGVAMRQLGLQVGMKHISTAISELFSSPMVMAMRFSSDYEKLFLKALVAEVQRTGMEDCKLATVRIQMDSLCRFEGVPVLPYPQLSHLLCQLSASRLILSEPGRKDVLARIRLNCAVQDVEFALGNVAGC